MKSLKLLCAIGIFCSLSAFADTVMTSAQLSAYSKAAVIALNQKTWTCTDQAGNPLASIIQDEDINFTVNNYLPDATSGILASAGNQPLLSFTTPFNVNTTNGVLTQVVIKVTSSADEKTAMSYELDFQSLENVNTGTLGSPSINQSWVTTSVAICQ